MATKAIVGSSKTVVGSTSSTPSSSSGAQGVSGLQAALAQLDPGQVKALKEVKVRDALTKVITLGQGVLAANQASTTDLTSQANLGRLNAAGMTLPAVTAIVQKGVLVLGDVTQRDAQEQQVHALTATLNADLGTLETAMANAASSLRGSFGNTSSELKTLGITPLGSGKKGGRKPTTSGSKKTGSSKVSVPASVPATGAAPAAESAAKA